MEFDVGSGADLPMISLECNVSEIEDRAVSAAFLISLTHQFGLRGSRRCGLLRENVNYNDAALTSTEDGMPQCGWCSTCGYVTEKCVHGKWPCPTGCQTTHGCHKELYWTECPQPCCGKHTITTRQVHQEVVLKLTRDRKCRFSEVASLAQEDTDGYPYFGSAYAFVSHSWDSPWESLVDAVSLHSTQWLRDHPGETPPYYWIDIFAVNQYWGTAANQSDMYDFRTPNENVGFPRVIRAAGRTLVLQEPWHNPRPDKRVWCLFEMNKTLEQGCELGVLLDRIDREECRWKIVGQRGLRLIEQAVLAIDVANANATVESDRDDIFSLVQATTGVDGLNDAVRSRLRDWLVEFALECIKRFEHLPSESELALEPEEARWHYAHSRWPTYFLSAGWTCLCCTLVSLIAYVFVHNAQATNAFTEDLILFFGFYVCGVVGAVLLGIGVWLLLRSRKVTGGNTMNVIGISGWLPCSIALGLLVNYVCVPLMLITPLLLFLEAPSQRFFTEYMTIAVGLPFTLTVSVAFLHFQASLSVGAQKLKLKVAEVIETSDVPNAEAIRLYHAVIKAADTAQHRDLLITGCTCLARLLIYEEQPVLAGESESGEVFAHRAEAEIQKHLALRQRFWYDYVIIGGRGTLTGLFSSAQWSAPELLYCQAHARAALGDHQGSVVALKTAQIAGLRRQAIQEDVFFRELLMGPHRASFQAVADAMQPVECVWWTSSRRRPATFFFLVVAFSLYLLVNYLLFQSLAATWRNDNSAMAECDSGTVILGGASEAQKARNAQYINGWYMETGSCYGKPAYTQQDYGYIDNPRLYYLSAQVLTDAYTGTQRSMWCISWEACDCMNPTLQVEDDATEPFEITQLWTQYKAEGNTLKYPFVNPNVTLSCSEQNWRIPDSGNGSAVGGASKIRVYTGSYFQLLCSYAEYRFTAEDCDGRTITFGSSGRDTVHIAPFEISVESWNYGFVQISSRQGADMPYTVFVKDCTSGACTRFPGTFDPNATAEPNPEYYDQRGSQGTKLDILSSIRVMEKLHTIMGCGHIRSWCEDVLTNAAPNTPKVYSSKIPERFDALSMLKVPE
ncbi:hypothetical protein CYMTET_7376 [Cymbomonas tetramitiformis]|uniref:Uncharacterized protein n=1 Tax=Cymbomonas tetramitiformis TaxID=36881 RepID=A0AAE0LH49_9CHLO|nr:hypothetical protein CYMTET_7376 [Cymbomonas tetramitiformis]